MLASNFQKVKLVKIKNSFELTIVLDFNHAFDSLAIDLLIEE